MLSPMYDMGFTRLGCWFCPNSFNKHIDYITKYMTEYLKELIDWSKEENKTSEKFEYNKTLEEIIKK